MAFAPETGDGTPGANAFFDVEQINAYHALRRNSEWEPKEQADKEGAIVEATDWIVGKGFTWKGEQRTAEQGLPFPRMYLDVASGVVLPAAMPALLLRAVAELALIRVTKGPLYNRNIPSATQGALIRKKTDVLEKQWSPLTPAQMAAQPAFDWIEDILAPLIEDAGGFSLQVVRT